jgi:hypothetical protein
MRGRSLLLGTVVTAVALFVWQSISNAALPWHMASMKPFSNDTAAVRSIAAIAPENGLYFSPRGALMVRSFTPDLADKSQDMGTPLGRQIVLDLVAAFALALVVSRLAAPAPLATGSLLGIAGLAAGIITCLSNWNWYDYPLAFEVVNTIDLGINLFIAGALLAWFARRGSRATVPAVDAGVRAEGGLSPLGARQPTSTG